MLSQALGVGDRSEPLGALSKVGKTPRADCARGALQRVGGVQPVVIVARVFQCSDRQRRLIDEQVEDFEFEPPVTERETAQVENIERRFAEGAAVPTPRR